VSNNRRGKTFLKEDQLMDNESVRQVEVGQIKSIAQTLVGSIPDLTFDEAEMITGDQARFSNESRKFIREFVDTNMSAYSVTVYSVTVNYDLTVEQMVIAGNYDSVSTSITQEHFPIQGEGRQEKEVTLFHFNRWIFSEEVIREMSKLGYQPAEPEDIFAFGIQHRDIQRQFPIVALGSPWQHPHHRTGYVVRLEGDHTIRSLNLRVFNLKSGPYYRFAAVHK